MVNNCQAAREIPTVKLLKAFLVLKKKTSHSSD